MKSLSLNKKKSGGLILAFILVACSILFSYLIAQQGEKVGALIVVVVLGIGCGLYAFLNPFFGFYTATLSGFLIFYFQRLFNLGDGMGAAVEALVYTTLAGVMFKKFVRHESLWNRTNHIISLFYLFYLTYVLIEFINPNGASIAGDLQYLRKAIQLLVTFYIALNIFDTHRQVVNFFKFWISIATLCGMYACYQEWFGLTAFETRWLFSDDTRVLIFSLDNGNYRKFSTMSDPTAFGILMAVSALFAIVLLLNSKKIFSKILYGFAIVFLVLGMSYSGTRTATFTLTIGVVFYILLTINDIKTIIFTGFAAMTFVVVIYGPIYGNPTINRLRSTFEFSGDESLQVRDINRKSIQPYIYAHPIGGGLLTTGVAGTQYNPGHTLAGFPSDSGLLRLALEIGWLGLLLQCTSYFIILKTGIRYYYRTKNAVSRHYYLAAIVVLFGNIVAQYSQVAIGQIPESFLFYSLVAIIIRLNQLEQSKKTLQPTI